MFECTRCNKIFTRKDSLLRHIKRLHMRESTSDNDLNTTSKPYLLKQAADNLPKSYYSDNDTERNDTDEDISQEYEENPSRLQATSKPAHSKFNYLRGSNDENNYNGNDIIPKLTTALQTVLDILLIKETQKEDVNEDDELPAKRIKYNHSDECENDNCIQSKEVLIKYWHNPNTLIYELKRLIITTEIGQQIFEVIRSLEENKDMQYFYNDTEREKQRKALMEELNDLKESNVGKKVFNIINTLQKADIIEPPADYLAECYKKDVSNYEDNTDADDDED